MCFNFVGPVPSLKNDYFQLFLLSAVSFPLIYAVYLYYYGSQWKILLPQLGLIIILSLTNSLIIFSSASSFAFLVSFSSGILIIPACYLINDFLFCRKMVTVNCRLVKKPVTLRTKHIFLYIVLFILNIYIQTTLSETLLPFCLILFGNSHYFIGVSIWLAGGVFRNATK